MSYFSCRLTLQRSAVKSRTWWSLTTLQTSTCKIQIREITIYRKFTYFHNNFHLSIVIVEFFQAVTNFASWCDIWGHQVLSSWLQNLIVMIKVRREEFGLVVKWVDNQNLWNCPIMRDIGKQEMQMSLPAKRLANLCWGPEWWLTVICGVHNHCIAKYLRVIYTQEDLSESATSTVIKMSKCHVSPKDILTPLKQDSKNAKKIYNARHKHRVIE